jgi:hypothetical protein
VQYSASMRRLWLARGFAVTGLSAIAAVAAHEGPGAVAAGRPLLAALAGAALAGSGIATLLAVSVSRHARAARVRRGDVLAARVDLAAAPGASALVAVLLVCQAGAHAGLLLAGVAAHGGPPGALALHALLALVAAGLVIGVERVLGVATATLSEAIAAAVAALAGRTPPSPRPAVRPRPGLAPRANRGRAPPLSAASAI